MMKYIWLDISIKRTIKHKKWYESVFPYASYAPWLTDKEFIKAFEIVNSYSLVDKYRCYELRDLVAESSKLEAGDLIEIGAWRGWSAALIAKKASLCSIDNQVHICDTFTWVVKAWDNDSDYNGWEHADTSEKLVHEVIGKLWVSNNTNILVWIFPDETWHTIEDKKFRFCHIDVDVYQSAKDIVERIRPKLVKWWIIVFDDYGFITCDGIVTLIDEEKKKKDRIVIHNLNGHAVIIKL